MKEIKLVLVGDACAGKIALWVADAENKLYTEYVPTVFDNYKKIINIAGQEYQLNVWDTGGCECYDRLRPQLNYSDTDVFVVVFSVVNPASYSNVTDKWIPEVKHHMPNIPIVLVGNQIDLRTDPDYLKQLAEQNEKPITTEMGGKLAREINAAAYIECSCLEIVEILFEKSIKK